MKGTGDASDVADVSVCANAPTNIEELLEGTQLPCIFPFYINGEFFDTCRLLNQDDFVVPINICPIRNITTKINGINNYIIDDLNDLLVSYSFCPNPNLENPGDLAPPLDPSINSCTELKSSSFSRCKNNCNRGKISSNQYTYTPILFIF